MLPVAFFSAESHNKLMNKACLTSLLPLLHLMDIIQTRTRTTFLARLTMMQARPNKRPLFHDASYPLPARNVPSFFLVEYNFSSVTGCFQIYMHMYAFNSIIIPSSRTLAKTSFCNTYVVPTNVYRYLFFSIQEQLSTCMILFLFPY